MDHTPTLSGRARCIEAWQAMIDLELSFGESGDATIIEFARTAISRHRAAIESERA